jgi:hypothetical protein
VELIPSAVHEMGPVARVWERRGTFKILVGNWKERGHLEDPGVDGRIVLKWILNSFGGHGLV